MNDFEQVRDFDEAEAYRAYRDVLSGAAARRRALRAVTQAFEDRLDSSLRAWQRGEPIGRDDEEILRERGKIR
jgi:hypothetical protein